MKFSSGHRSDVGRGRPDNEDSFLVDDEDGLYAVADGMGGHRAGEVASATAIETLQAAYLGGQRLDEAVEAANAAVFAKGADDAALRGMGTTLTAIALEGDSTALLGHVGDSRAYLMRDGAVTQVTDDHSLVEQLVREGRLSPEEAQNHPQRAIITRALGVDAEVEVDTYRVDLHPGDRLLICSDGLTNMLSDDTIAVTLRRHADPQQAAETLVDMANQAGGDDNITVVVLDALADGASPGRAASALAVAGEPTGELRMAEADGGAAGPDGELTASASGPGLAEPDGGLIASAPGRDLAGPDGGLTGPDGRAARPDGGAAGPDGPDSGVEVAPAGRRRGRGREAGRRRGLRGVALWGLPILAVIGIAVGAVGWYARRTYYVGLSADRVTLFKGVPGGLLGWQPTVDRRTDLTAADLTPADRADLQTGHRFASRSDANRFVARLQQAHEALAGTTTTTGVEVGGVAPGEPVPTRGPSPTVGPTR